MEDIEELEIPQTLKVPVVGKFYDSEWTKSSMNHLDDTMEENVDFEISEIDEDADFESSKEEDMGEVDEKAEPFEECEAQTAAAKCPVLETMQWVFCCCCALLIKYICS